MHTKKTTVVIILFAILFSTHPLIARDEFPNRRPKKVRLYCDTGIFIHYGGNKWLTTEIKLNNGEKRHYFRVSPDYIDGKYYFCDFPPRVDKPERDSIFCEDWPSDVVLGKTRVRVVYWWGRVQGHRDRISDEIHVLREK